MKPTYCILPHWLLLFFHYSCRLQRPIHIDSNTFDRHSHILACRFVDKICCIYLYEELSVVDKKRIIQTKSLTDFKPMFLLYTSERTKTRRFCEVFHGARKENISVKYLLNIQWRNLKFVLETIEMTLF